jgi:hypothetical protein
MPRYFFDLHNDIDAEDLAGSIMLDLEAANAYAVSEVREMAAASITERGSIDLRHSIQIRDEGGKVVGETFFEDAVRFVRAGAPV